VEILLALPDVHGCSSPTSTVDPEPYEGASEAEARTLRQRIDAVRVRAAASQYGHAVPEAQIVVDEARRLGSDALLAEARLAQAEVHDDLGEVAPAMEALRDAAVAARSSGHARAELEALVELAAVLGVRRREPSRAAFYLERADAVLEAIGDAPDLEARLALTRGRVAFVQGRDEDARVELELARDLAAQRVGPADAAVAAAQAQLAGVLLRQGDTPGAELLLEDVLAIYERVYGPHHPRVASTLGNLGLVRADSGRYDAALDAMTRGRAIFEGAFGAEHPAVATADDSIGDVLRRVGRCDEAARHFERAIALFERLGVEGPQLAAPLLGLGRCALANDAAAALVVLERAWEHAGGEDVSPVQRGETALALALAHLAADDRDAARPLLDRAEADFTLALDPEDDRWDELTAARR
jgi:tetratricopeptide (TPR) repeat protein